MVMLSGVTTERNHLDLDIDSAGFLEDESDRNHIASYERRV